MMAIRTRPQQSAPDADPEARVWVHHPQALVRAAAAGEASTVRTLEGYASVTESAYDMWDWYGPYAEVISRGAFTKTLSETPDVALLLNHKGMTLARTKSGTLELAEDDTGLHTIARVDTRVSAVSDMVLQMERGDLDEMSFAFMIVRGKWSPDYSEYRIDEVSLAKGDVSVVNYGANPATSVALREQPAVSAEFRGLSSLDLARLIEPDHVAATRRRLARNP
jgi:HK97 family phage prohead protease